MDEDYDACDLENWFLAIQSADGQVMIPSFHRPSIIRFDPSTSPITNDWIRSNAYRPERTALGGFGGCGSCPCKADGHDAATFGDLMPDSTTGLITYDVDNDGDGQTDSVWLDLGYPRGRTAAAGCTSRCSRSW